MNGVYIYIYEWDRMGYIYIYIDLSGWWWLEHSCTIWHNNNNGKIQLMLYQLYGLPIIFPFSWECHKIPTDEVHHFSGQSSTTRILGGIDHHENPQWMDYLRDPLIYLIPMINGVLYLVISMGLYINHFFWDYKYWLVFGAINVGNIDEHEYC